MSNREGAGSSDENSTNIKTREMYKRLIAVAELLKKSSQQHVEIQQPESEKTQDSKAVVT